MNERIRDLAEQAGVFAGDFAGAGIYSIHNKDEVEKFAELIVRECANIDFRRELGLSNNQDCEVSQLIKNHFGVKE
jgi:hypothetical protein